ncbi:MULTISPECIES: hypothetical protein [unclassified Bradyrhizobium]|jgi:hypothetical protein|uniref:hypothetical protein n=1 Tax=unclassified Bradyrhizobium TaxID=2631580 RepID=UPI000769B868|nr:MULTISPECIES: hypothetical protein [unclassified Bradyrhizobium]
MAIAIMRAGNALNTLRDALSDYLARHRLILYHSLAGVVAGGIAFNWHWLTVSETIRLLTALPCMLMMFKCFNCGTHRSTDEAVSAESRTAQTG